MAAITPIKTTEAGVANATLSTPSASDTYTWYGTLILVITNGNASTCNVTVVEQASTDPIVDPNYGNLTKASATLAVAAGNTGIIGPFKQGGFKDSSNNITVTTDVQSSVTVLPIYQ